MGENSSIWGQIRSQGKQRFFLDSFRDLLLYSGRLFCLIVFQGISPSFLPPSLLVSFYRSPNFQPQNDPHLSTWSSLYILKSNSLKCTGDLSLQIYPTHSVPLLSNNKTVWIFQATAIIFITHHWHTNFSKTLSPLFYKYIQHIVSYLLYFISIRHSQLVIGAILLCWDVQRWVRDHSRHQEYYHQIELLRYVL